MFKRKKWKVMKPANLKEHQGGSHITFLARPQGEWIGVTNGRGGHECSNCHAYAPSYMSGDEHLSVFCPNCGARMKGADDE